MVVEFTSSSMVNMTEQEKPAQESELPIKLVIRGSGFKIVTEGTISSISKELDALSNFTEEVTQRFEIPEEEFEEGIPAGQEPSVSPEEVAKISSADIPAIKPSKKTIDNLEAIFSTPWGRTPRGLAEIMKALEVNTAFDKVSSVNVYLTRLVHRGVLRRIEKEGKWAYFKVPE
jgi:hypothetical protein